MFKLTRLLRLLSNCCKLSPKSKKRIIFIVSLSFVLGANIYFRAGSIYLPQLKDQAKSIVEQKIRQEVIKGIDEKFSDLNIFAKKTLANVALSDYKKQNKKEVEKLIQENYFKLKDPYQDAAGQTYLSELDCWDWAKYTENVFHSGHVGDKVVDGKELNSFMLAPSGSYISWNNFLFYFSSFLYKVFSFINPAPLFNFLFYLPLFFTAVFIVLLYLFCFYHWDNLTAVITSLFVGLSPIFLSRSCAGWFDTDIFNLLFPLLIVWSYLLACSASSVHLRTRHMCIAGFWVGLFCCTWQYWWFIATIIFVCEAYSMVNLVFIYWQYKEENFALFRQRLFSLSSFLLFSSFWVIIFSGIQPLKDLYGQIQHAFNLNTSLTVSIWPNVYSTVSELRKVDIVSLAKSIGGVGLLFLPVVSLGGLFIFVFSKKKCTVFQREAIVIMIFWFMSMCIACLKGIRFSMFIIVPLGLSLGWGVSELCKYYKTKKIMLGYIAVIVIALMAGLFNNAYSLFRGTYPLMGDTWYRALTQIKEYTPKEAIINSWWDFGDWFRVVANRRVIFDGQSQDMPQAYWMARVLITNNEKEAIRILRMLNNGGNKAFDIINEHIKDPIKSVIFLKKLLSCDILEAKNSLAKFLPPLAAKDVSKILFNKPDKAYFVVDSTMQYKIFPISYIGNWDFVKFYINKNINKKTKEEITRQLSEWGIDSSQARKLYDEAILVSQGNLDLWLSPRLQLRGGIEMGSERNGAVFFDNGLVYNPKEQTVDMYSSADRKYITPGSLFILKQGKLEEISYPGNDLNPSVLIFKNQKEEYRCIAFDRELAGSLFARLLFLKGKGLKYFKPFIEEEGEDNYIGVFEIVWDGIEDER